MQHKQTPHTFTTQSYNTNIQHKHTTQTQQGGLTHPRSHQVASSSSPPRYRAATSSPRTIHMPREISPRRAYTRDSDDVGHVAKSPGLFFLIFFTRELDDVGYVRKSPSLSLSLCVCVRERERASERERERKSARASEREREREREREKERERERKREREHARERERNIQQLFPSGTSPAIRKDEMGKTSILSLFHLQVSFTFTFRSIVRSKTIG